MSDPAGDLEQAKLGFEREKWQQEFALRKRELKRQVGWSSPLVIAILGAALAAGGNLLVNLFNANATEKLEREKAESALILEVVKTGNDDVKKAAGNLSALLQMGLITDPNTRASLQAYLDKPVAPISLPASVATSAPPTVPLYNVVTASFSDKDSAQKAADNANAMFQREKSDLRAQALPPPQGSPWWGVYVGVGVSLADARGKTAEAKKLCCKENQADDGMKQCCMDTYPVRIQ
jgi:hypothetical protein